MKRQLDMFKAEIVAFPFDRRREDVRRCAQALMIIHGDDAQRYWKKLIRSMADPLKAAGVSPEDVRRQMFAFQEAVQAELWSLHDQPARGAP